jgi:hypothetical protein
MRSAPGWEDDSAKRKFGAAAPGAIVFEEKDGGNGQHSNC